MEEIEVKFLDINKEEIEQKLIKLGARRLGDFLFKRIVFDYPDWRLNTDNAWLRLRDEGEKVTLTYKKRLGTDTHDGSTSDVGMHEIEIIVDDFEKTKNLLLTLGFIEKKYQEQKRTRYVLDDIEFDIDIWPRLNPYLEIETSSWEKIDQAIDLLGLSKADKKIFSTYQVYQLAGIDEHDYQKMAFDEWVKK